MNSAPNGALSHVARARRSRWCRAVADRTARPATGPQRSVR